MPNLLGWSIDDQTKEFGAMVQLNAHTFRPQPSGQVDVISTPRTEFFSEDRIKHMAGIAGEKSRDFWENVERNFPAQKALYENMLDISGETPKSKPIDIQRDRAAEFRP